MRPAPLALALILALVTPAVTAAQTDRDGFFIGFGIGGGSLAFEDGDDREAGASGYFKLGGAVSDKVLIGAEATGWSKSEDGVTLSVGALAATAYIYPSLTSGFFLRGGLGIANLTIGASDGPFDVSADDTGVGIVIGAGWDFGFGGRFGLTPFAGFSHLAFDGYSANYVQLGVGFNWY